MAHTPSIMTYNGVSLLIEQVNVWEDNPVYTEDDTTRLFDHIRIGVTAIVNPAATDFGSLSGPISLRELPKILLSHNQPLTVAIDGVTIIGVTSSNNPITDQSLAVDAHGGPRPRAFNVLKILGVKTAVIYFEVETWINHCPDTIHLLSSRWEERHDISRDYYTTRIIEGEAIFRLNLLHQASLRADQFRKQLFHPIPTGYRREHVVVSCNSDGTRLKYTIVDKQQPLPMHSTKIADIKGEFKAGFANESVLFVSQRYMSMRIRATANPYGSTQDCIEAVIRGAISFGFPPNLRAGANYGYSASITVGIGDKWAQYDGTFVLPGGFGGTVNKLNPFTPGVGQVRYDHIESWHGDVALTYIASGEINVADTRQPPPPGDSLSRADKNLKMFAQVLKFPCETPWIATELGQNYPDNKDATQSQVP